MENKTFLDTDFLIDFLRNKDFAVSFMKESEQNHICISIISLYELFYGAFKSQSSKKLISVEKLASRINIFGINYEIAKEAARIYADLERRGQTLEFKDVLIGTTALLNKGNFKANNIRHFQRIEGLKII